MCVCVCVQQTDRHTYKISVRERRKNRGIDYVELAIRATELNPEPTYDNDAVVQTDQTWRCSSHRRFAQNPQPIADGAWRSKGEHRSACSAEVTRCHWRPPILTPLRWSGCQMPSLLTCAKVQNGYEKTISKIRGTPDWSLDRATQCQQRECAEGENGHDIIHRSYCG